LEIQTPWY